MWDVLDVVNEHMELIGVTEEVAGGRRWFTVDTKPKQPNGKEGESAHKNLHTKQDMQKIVRKASLVFFLNPLWVVELYLRTLFLVYIILYTFSGLLWHKKSKTVTFKLLLQTELLDKPFYKQFSDFIPEALVLSHAIILSNHVWKSITNDMELIWHNAN